MGVNPFSSGQPSDAAAIADSVHCPQSFAAVFDRHFEAVHAYLSRRAGAGRADDLTSATFTVAFERRSSFDAAANSARPWLFGIATNLLRNEWRAQQRAFEAIAQLSRTAVDAAAGPGTDRLVEAGVVGRFLVELAADQRDVLLLYAWEGFSYQEIAASLDVPVGTVRSRLARARARLRSALEAERSGPALSGDRQEMGE